MKVFLPPKCDNTNLHCNSTECTALKQSELRNFFKYIISITICIAKKQRHILQKNLQMMAYNVYTHKRRTFLHIRSSSDDQITQIIFRIHIYSDSWPIIRFFHHITDYLSVDGLWQTESEIDVESAQETE